MFYGILIKAYTVHLLAARSSEIVVRKYAHFNTASQNTVG